MNVPCRVLMVCTGNICRSPTAEVVLRHKLAAAGLDGQVIVTSAGTHAGWHADQAPDARATRHAAQRGYDLSRLRARSVVADDFAAHDLIIAMDEDNFASLQSRCAPEHHPKLGRLAGHGRLGAAEIPDPYFGPPAGFDRVLDLVEDACDGLVAHLLGRLSPR